VKFGKISIKLKSGGIDLKTILNKTLKSKYCLRFYLSGPQQVRWGLIWSATPKSLPIHILNVYHICIEHGKLMLDVELFIKLIGQ